MKSLTTLLALPTTLLVFIAASGTIAEHLVRPRNLSHGGEYSPEDAAHVERILEAERRLAWQTPIGMKKMGIDATEKFWPHYWDFGQSQDTLDNTNATLGPQHPEAPVLRHSNHNKPPWNLFGRDLVSRDFTCPTETNPCSNLGSSLCCPSGQTCISVTGGGVGCCPSGLTCGSIVAPCATASGYTSCPNSPGGCCIPGASCAGTGCILVGTSTVQVTAATGTVTTGQSSTTTTTTASPSAAIAYTTTVTVTQSQGGSATTIVSATTVLIATSSITSPTTSTPQQGALSCTAGFQSCPASFGGGCCPNGQICASNSLCLDSTTGTGTATAGAPIFPTSIQTTSETTVSASTAAGTTAVNTVCPTGYYVCSAFYLGGCCQIGQNCASTNCPSTAGTAVESSGATIVVPNTSVATPAVNVAAVSQGSCPGGWYSCAASVGGGCCASGYLCGTATCSATISGLQNTGKEAPSGASATSWAWGLMALALLAGVGMVWL